MIPINDILLFAGAATIMVLTPGPNMIYLISRSICQGKKAGITSLMGVVLGFCVHALAATMGISALFLAVPAAYQVLKWMGAAYLLWLAWQAVKPGASSPFQAQDLPHDSSKKLISMGFYTSVLNPKIAIFYVSIFPQFISPENGSLFWQSLELSLVQVCISSMGNFFVVLSAAAIASWFAQKPTWMAVQRYFMGLVLAGLAARLALEQRRI